jgi:hypothetical protein
MSFRLILCSTIILAIQLLTGCNSEPTPVKVSGTVSVDGKPLANGAIYFSAPGNTPDTLAVTDGRFEGLVKPGEKRVEIHGYGKAGAKPEPTKGEQPPAPEAKVNTLPSKYNEKSTLKATVTATGVEPSKFELQSN